MHAAGFRVVGDALVLPADASLPALTCLLSRLRSIASHRGQSGDAEFFPLPTRSAEGAGGSSYLVSQTLAMYNHKLPFVSAAVRARHDKLSTVSVTSHLVNICVVCCDLREAVTMIIACMQNTPGFRYQTVIHHCTLCDHPINDGSERLFTGSYDSPKGECRCIVAPPNSNCTFMCHSRVPCSTPTQWVEVCYLGVKALTHEGGGAGMNANSVSPSTFVSGAGTSARTAMPVMICVTRSTCIM